MGFGYAIEDGRLLTTSFDGTVELTFELSTDPLGPTRGEIVVAQDQVGTGVFRVTWAGGGSDSCPTARD